MQVGRKSCASLFPAVCMSMRLGRSVGLSPTQQPLAVSTGWVAGSRSCTQHENQHRRGGENGEQHVQQTVMSSSTREQEESRTQEKEGRDVGNAARIHAHVSAPRAPGHRRVCKDAEFYVHVWRCCCLCGAVTHSWRLLRKARRAREPASLGGVHRMTAAFVHV